MPQNELRILTYNIHKGFSAGNRHFILPKLRDALTTENADIMLLQEVQGEHKQHELTQVGWPDRSHADYVAEGTWPHVVYGKNAMYRLGHHGNAILSKYPIIRWDNINVSALSWASRSLLHAVIKLPAIDENLHIICIHLGLINMERKQQIKILSERIEDHVPKNAPLIIAGDFNDWSEKAGKHFSEQLNLQETHHTLHNKHARTFPAWLPFLKMDRVYFRKVKPISCERPHYHLWRRLSDHAPLIAKFEICNEVIKTAKKAKY
ncbi:MAG: endonuclease/exonuclease/phosphatase family metal-dependent hydrolase [Methylophagaceae bacterium]|jgi:endonuclease/exonuclease/phosphatase family metal-dependent hydrolase